MFKAILLHNTLQTLTVVSVTIVQLTTLASRSAVSRQKMYVENLKRVHGKINRMKLAND